MDAMREQINRPLGAGILGFVVGLILGIIIGLPLLGWAVFPVRYVNPGIPQLRLAEKEEVLRMTIEAYGRSGDVPVAQARFARLGEEGPQAFSQVRAEPRGLSPELLDSFETLVVGGQPLPTPLIPAETPGPGTLVTPTAAPGDDEEGGGLGWLVPLLCVVVLLAIGAGIGYILYLNRGSGGDGAPTPAMQAREAARTASWTDHVAAGEDPPIAQFMASYKLGDDLFDDSFSIDSLNGEFMGECGVGISETIGVGDPKKVTAFEVWIFDKNDIQTVTKVFMSDHAFDDESLRNRLSAKGEPVLAEPGARAFLETQTLRMVARIVEMGYGEGALPRDSFFDRFILELAIWQK
jgi:hypothetical protein